MSNTNAHNTTNGKVAAPKRALRQAAEPVTQERFARLPALLTRSEFQQITGVSDEMLKEKAITANHLSQEECAILRGADLLPVYREHGGYAKYYKADAARIAGFKF